MSDFGLKADLQRESFPAQMARQMGAGLSLPLIQAPGIGDLPGFPRLPVRVPAMYQNTVREEFPPLAPPQNLAVPGLTLKRCESCARRRRSSTATMRRGPRSI